MSLNDLTEELVAELEDATQALILAAREYGLVKSRWPNALEAEQVEVLNRVSDWLGEMAKDEVEADGEEAYYDDVMMAEDDYLASAETGIREVRRQIFPNTVPRARAHAGRLA